MLKIKHLNLHFLNPCKYYDNQKVFYTYDNYWNNWAIRGLKQSGPNHILQVLATKYAEPCFHIPVIVQNLYLYNLILEKKYAPALDNYGQSCLVGIDLKKNEVCLYDTNDAPV